MIMSLNNGVAVHSVVQVSRVDMWLDSDDEALLLALRECKGDVEAFVKFFSDLTPQRPRTGRALLERIHYLVDAGRAERPINLFLNALRKIETGAKGRASIGRWLDIRQACQKFGHHKGFFYDRAAAGTIRTQQLYGQMRFSSRDCATAHAERAASIKQMPTIPIKKDQTAPIVVPAKPVETVVPPTTPATNGAMLERIRYYLLGVELGEFTKEQAFDQIARLIEEKD